VIFSLSSRSESTISWAKWELTPEYINQGQYKNLGYLDQFLNYVIKRIPEYQHSSEYKSINRLSRSWKEGNVCSLHLWLGYWPTKIVYSKPYAFTPRFGIIVKKDSLIDKKLKGKKTISLNYLLKSTNFKLGILPLFYIDGKNSRYPLLKNIISPYLKSKKVTEFSNSKNEMSVDFIESKRVDYIIRQRITHMSEMKIAGKNSKLYKFYQLEEANENKLVAAACSNSKLGKSVIKKINSFIDSNHSFYQNYLKYRSNWDVNNSNFSNLYLDYFIRKIPNKSIRE
jgi:uncharacterized protein (TIGR02285 family)